MNNKKCPITGEIKCKCDQNYNVSIYPSLKDTLRKLFTDYVIYTYLYINSFMNELQNTSDITNRLLNNQKDIRDTMGTIIGKENSYKLTELSKEHIMIAVEAISAIKK